MISKFIARFVLPAFVVLSFSSYHAKAQNACHEIFTTPDAVGSARVLNLQTYVEHYSEYLPIVNDMIAMGIERYEKKSPKGYCFRAVKQLLWDSGVVRRKVDGTFAYSAHAKNFLVNRGFVNLLERAPFRDSIKGAYDERIPKGAILVYAGTNGVDNSERPLGSGVGHIEIKCGPNCYLYDGVNQFPGGGEGGLIREPGVYEAGTGMQHRRLVGVYVLDFFSLF